MNISFDATLKSMTVACMAVVLAACASGGRMGDKTADQTVRANNADKIAQLDDCVQQADGVRACFPDVGKSWLGTGAFVNVDQLRRMDKGLTREEVRKLISYPHFNEGFFNPSVWNYVFNFRTGSGVDYIQCPYQVQFDRDKRVSGMYWQDADCAQVLMPKVNDVVRPLPPPVVLAPPERLTLSADALFAFDKAGSADILAGGREQIAQLVRNLNQTYSRIEAVTVIGHTDTLGSETYNQALSVQRAATVRDLLIAQGIPDRAVRSVGLGKMQPVKLCETTLPKMQMIDCQQPNRRVEIEIVGEKK